MFNEYKKHPFLFITLIFSLIIMLVYVSTTIYLTKGCSLLILNNFIYYFLLFLPVVIIHFINCGYIQNSEHYKKIKLVSVFLNIFVLITQIVLSFIVMIFGLLFLTQLDFNNSKDYTKAINSFDKQEQKYISHFPSSVLDGWNNISFMKSSDYSYCNYKIYLKFTPDTNHFIPDELKKHQYKKINNSSISNFPEITNDFDIYKLDIPNNNKSYHASGIAINKKTNIIIYFAEQITD